MYVNMCLPQKLIDNFKIQLFEKIHFKEMKAREKNFVNKKTVCDNKTFMISYSIAMLFFLLSTSLCCQVGLSPEILVVELGKTDAFQCSSSGVILSYSWFINNNKVNKSPEVIINHLIRDGVNFFIMELINISQSYNGSTVQCSVTSISGCSNHSRRGIILIQGRLSRPSGVSYDINKWNICISWDHVFSLNITNKEHNVLYCIYLFNESRSVSNICGLTENLYCYEQVKVQDLVCSRVSFIVGAENSVGQTNSIKTKISIADLNISNIETEKCSGNGEEKCISISMTNGICKSNTSVIKNKNIELNFTIEGFSTLKFVLPNNKHSEIRIASGMFTNIITISTFDVIRTVVKNDSNGVFLKSSFYNNSDAWGVLYGLILISQNNSDYYFFVLVNKSNAEIGITINLPYGVYLILTYDVDSNFTLPNNDCPAFVLESIFVPAETSNAESLSELSPDCKMDVDKDCYKTIYFNGTSKSTNNLTVRSVKCSDFDNAHCLPNAICNMVELCESDCNCRPGTNGQIEESNNGPDIILVISVAIIIIIFSTILAIIVIIYKRKHSSGNKLLRGEYNFGPTNKKIITLHVPSSDAPIPDNNSGSEAQKTEVERHTQVDPQALTDDNSTINVVPTKGSEYLEKKSYEKEKELKESSDEAMEQKQKTMQVSLLEIVNASSTSASSMSNDEGPKSDSAC